MDARAGFATAWRLHNPAVQTTVGIATTFILVSFAWIFFRARSVPDVYILIRNLVRFNSVNNIYAPWAGLTDATGVEMALAWGLIGVLGLVHLSREGRLRLLASAGSRAWVRWVVYLILALAITNLGVALDFPFVYAGF